MAEFRTAGTLHLCPEPQPRRREHQRLGLEWSVETTLESKDSTTYLKYEFDLGPRKVQLFGLRASMRKIRQVRWTALNEP